MFLLKGQSKSPRAAPLGVEPQGQWPPSSIIGPSDTQPRSLYPRCPHISTFSQQVVLGFWGTSGDEGGGGGWWLTLGELMDRLIT